MTKVLSFLALFLLLAVALAVALLNMTPVGFDFYIGRTEGPLAVILAVALGIGALLGLAASFGLLLGQRRQNGRLRRRCELCEQEIRNLRQIPIQDKH